MGIIKHYTSEEINSLTNKTIPINHYCRLGISFDRQPGPEGKDTYFTENKKDFSFEINDSEITIGRTHIYELTEAIQINNISFLKEGVPETIGVDIIYEDEQGVE